MGSNKNQVNTAAKRKKPLVADKRLSNRIAGWDRTVKQSGINPAAFKCPGSTKK